MKELIDILEKFLQDKSIAWDEIEVIQKYSRVYNKEEVELEEYYDHIYCDFVYGERKEIRDYELGDSVLKFRILIIEYNCGE